MRRWLRRKESTVTRYLAGLRFLEDASGKPFLTDLSQRLTAQDVMSAIIANPHYAPETCAIAVKAAKSWEKTGEALGWWTANGILKLSYPQPEHSPKPSLTPPQVQQLLATCRTAREWRLVGLGLFAGMRVGDAEAIREENWLEDRIRYRAAKTGNRVEVPLHPELAKLRQVILNVTPGKNTLKVLGARLAKRTRFDWSPNTLRATFTQRLLDLEVPLWVVKDLRGDTQREVVFTHYATVPWPHKIAAIEELRY